MKSLLVRLQNAITLWLVIFLRIDKSNLIPLSRLGTNYGGWFVPAKVLKGELGKKFLISAGIGHDVSFDLEMQKCGFKVVAIDPLKDCCDYAQSQLISGDGLTVINAGLWKESGSIQFFPPSVRNSNSWSITNEHRSEENLGINFPTITLSEVLKKIRIDADSYVILKVDIEGAERFIFEDIVDNSSYLDFVCVELDFLQILPFLSFNERRRRIKEARKLILLLREKNFRLIHTEGFNFFWIKYNSHISELQDGNWGEIK